MKKILFAGFLRSHFSNLLPLLASIVRRSRVTMTPGRHIGEDPPSRDTLPSGVQYIRLPAGNLPSHYESYLARLCSIRGGDPIFQPLLSARYSEKERTRHARALAETHAAIVQTLDQVQPDLLVVPKDSDMSRGRAWCVAARRAGLRIVTLWPTWYNVMDQYPEARPALSPLRLVFGDAVRRRIRFAGSECESVETVGSPHFDVIKQWRPMLLPKELYAHIGMARPYILYSTQSRPDADFYLGELLKSVTRVKGLGLVVKLHPSDNPRRYQRRLAAHSGCPVAMIQNELGFLELAHYARATATISSTTAFESLIHGHAVIVLDYPLPGERLAAATIGSPFAVASNADELRRVVENSDEFPSRETIDAFLDDQIGPLDGNRAQAIAERLMFLSA